MNRMLLCIRMKKVILPCLSSPEPSSLSGAPLNLMGSNHSHGSIPDQIYKCSVKMKNMIKRAIYIYAKKQYI